MAVVTSAAKNESSGTDIYNIDDEHGLSYKNVFTKFGFFQFIFSTTSTLTK